jgi:hypothetical protein
MPSMERVRDGDERERSGMLAKLIPIRFDCRIFEGDSPEGRELRVEGRWTPEDSALREALGS